MNIYVYQYKKTHVEQNFSQNVLGGSSQSLVWMSGGVPKVFQGDPWSLKDFNNNSETLFTFFHHFDIYTDGIKALRGKTAGTFAEIKAVAPIVQIVMHLTIKNKISFA